MSFFSKTQKIIESDETKLSRGLFSIVTQLINKQSPDSLSQEFCNVFTDNSPHISMAWLWFGNPTEDTIRPQFSSGPARAYALNTVINRNFVTNYGPFFKALDGEKTVSFRISATSLYGPWRALHREHGVQSAIAVRLFSELNSQIGILVLYSTVADYFDAIGIEFFEKIGPLVGAILAQTTISAELERKANTDMLTGLSNRAHSINLFEQLKGGKTPSVADKRQSEETSNSVIMFDIDRFKLINDTYGHAVGDAVIVEVARRARAAVRDTDTVIRWGGEEFLVIAYKTSLDQAVVVGEKVRAAIDYAEVLVGELELTVTVSVGVATISSGELISDAVRRADEKLYHAKTSGRNRVSS